MVKYGQRLIGLSRRITRDVTFRPGAVYEINLQETKEGILDPQGVAEFLLSKLNEQFPEIKVNWINVSAETQTIGFQFTTVPLTTLGFQPRAQSLSAATLIPWLPAILTLIGLSVLLISIFSILAAIPWWAWALLATGMFLFVFGPYLARAMTPKKYR